MQIGLKMEAGDCPTLNMNAMEIYLLSQSLIVFFMTVYIFPDGKINQIKQ